MSTQLAPTSVDRRLGAAIARRAKHEFWGSQCSTKSIDARRAPFQYPAMMVSEMQGVLLRAVAEVRPEPPLVYDPFVGSGATMLEAMRQGFPFAGSDINPLAILISRVRSGEAEALDIDGAIDAACERARELEGEIAAPAEPWCETWFRPDVAAGLAALHFAIAGESEARLRRLLWISLAEVVRRAGNFRISTPKLQMRPPAELSRPIDVFQRFRAGAQATAAHTREFLAELADGRVRGGGYRPGLRLVLGDACRADALGGELAEVVLSSPPYGDNHTTMPYGQASYLPLKWIDPHDLGDEFKPQLLQAGRALDTSSLGGSRRVDTGRVAHVISRSSSLAALLDRELTGDGRKRVSSFFIDMDEALAAILDRCTPDAHIVLTLGDRTVSGLSVPTTKIVEELLTSRGTSLVTRVKRPLPRQKRLALRNSYTATTIRVETVLIMRRSGS